MDIMGRGVWSRGAYAHVGSKQMGIWNFEIVFYAPDEKSCPGAYRADAYQALKRVLFLIPWC